MQNMAESQVKRMKMTLDVEKRERRRKDWLEQAERTRKHELEIAKFYITAFASIHQTANLNQLLPIHAPQETMIKMHGPTELNSPGLTPPYLTTPQSNPRNGFVN